MPNSQQESFLVLRAQVGDREALDSVLRNTQQPVYTYLRNMLHDAALAEDTLQDVLLIVCRKLKTLREPNFFRTWVYRIASRQAFKTMRREKVWRGQVRDLGLIDEPAAVEIADAEDPIDAQAVAESLVWLSPAVRAVLALHYLEALSLSEVGAVLSIPIGTVKSRLAYGLQKLREKWNHET